MPSEPQPAPTQLSLAVTTMMVTVVSLVVGGAIGFFLGRGTSPLAKQPATNIALDGMDTLKQFVPREQKPTAPSVPTAAFMSSLVGIVQSVTKDSFVVHTEEPPFANGDWLVERRITVDADTTFIRMVPKDTKQSAADAKAFVERQNENPSAQAGKPPSPYEERPTTFADIHVGSLVVVFGAPDADIAVAPTFTATRVETGPKPVPPTSERQ